jgi:hypothetical protein
MRRLLPLFVSLWLLSIPALKAAKDHGPLAVASMTARSCKPGSSVELIVTVRGAVAPAIKEIDRPLELRIKPLRKARKLTTEEGEVWLFRYRVKAMKCGDYEIAPIRVTDAGKVIETRPLFLHVSTKAEKVPYSERELSDAVALPLSLCREVVTAAPQPVPKPEPTPVPDTRPFGAKVISSVKKGAVSFWNYPGKSAETP